MPVADITIILIDYYLNTIISELFGLELLTLSVICSVPIPIVNKKIINSQHVIIIQKNCHIYGGFVCYANFYTTKNLVITLCG